MAIGQTVARGIGTGFLATQALDLVSIWLYENLDWKTREHEDTARSGRQAYEVAVDKIARGLGYSLSEDQLKFWGWKFHRAFGLLGGLQYLLLRRKFPQIGRGLGLGYGIAFFLVADQFLIYLLKLTPGPTQFPFRTHARGAIAHIAYGVVAELAARSYERITPYEQSNEMVGVTGTHAYA